MDINFNKNEDHNKLLVSDLRKRLNTIKLGGGTKRIEKHHAKGKMTARERIDYLIDDDSDFIEIGAFAGYEMAEVTCPTKYFEEASSINFARSSKYGLGVIRVSWGHFLQRLGILKLKMYEKPRKAVRSKKEKVG